MEGSVDASQVDFDSENWNSNESGIHHCDSSHSWIGAERHMGLYVGLTMCWIVKPEEHLIEEQTFLCFTLKAHRRWFRWRINPNKHLHEATGIQELQLPKSIHRDSKCVADVNHIRYICPISELGQNIVDYWTHLMLKTNTSYFTGSSQLNNRFFFFHICNTLRNIHSHGCIQTLSLCWFSSNNITSTNCMRHPFVWQWSC